MIGNDFKYLKNNYPTNKKYQDPRTNFLNQGIN